MARTLVGRMLVIGLALCLAACAATRGGSIAYNQSNFGAPDAPVVVSADANYKLAPLDTVTVTVFQVPDLSKDYSIDQSGQLVMPLLGRVDAVGLTTTELSDKITRQLDARYLRNPNVTITLKDSVSRVFTVDGSVKQPGVFKLTSSMTLVQAIAFARGPDELANPRRVAIFRTIGGKRMAAAFDLTSIRRGEAADPAIYAGDTIVVDGSGIKSAQRNILQSLPLASIFLAL